MKLTLTIFLFCLAGAAASTYSQNTRLDIKLENGNMVELVKQIEAKSEFMFYYQKKELQELDQITVEAKNATVMEILDKVTKGTSFDYSIIDRYIVVRKIGDDFGNKFLATAKENVAAQQRAVSGKVTDSNNQPLPGATISIKGTTQGTVTDMNGNYTLTNIPADATLVFSFVGMRTQEVVVGNQTTINVRMEEETIGIEEVVAIGYGTMRKSDLTGAVASVTNKEFSNQPVKNVQDILRGRAPGVQVTSLSGIPGGGTKVRIRGTTSINKSSDPLYVVDGIVSTTGLNGINPSDIQSIEVLKDASSTAIYGSRGANGVVLVTTVQGQEGAARIVVDASVGFSNMTNSYDLMNAYEYANALNEIRGAGTISAADLQAYQDGTKGIDYLDRLTQTGLTQDYRLSISGGSTKNKYHVSGSVLDWDAITVTTNYKRYNVRANIDTEVNNWFTMSANASASRIHSHNGSIDLMAALAYSPTMKEWNEEGGYWNMDPYNAVSQNPLSRLHNYNDNYENHVNLNANLLFKIAEGLTFSVQGGYNYRHSPSYSFVSKTARPGQINSMSNNSNQNLYWQNTNNLTYAKQFGKHGITATGVWEISKTEYSALGITGSNLNSESVGYWNVNNAQVRNQSNSYSGESMASGVGRVMYNYDSKYLVTGTFRADGSSKFIGDNKWGYFPSLALAWDAAKEDFMLDQDLFQQLKFRVSAGITGNQAIDRYATLGTLTSTAYGWGTPSRLTGYWGNVFASPDLTWEKTYQYDVGLDFSMFYSKLFVTLDWFLKESKDLLFQKSVPLYNGGGNFWVNEGEVKNTGFEVGITAYPLDGTGSEFNWETTLNGSYIKNEIVDLAGQEFILQANYSDFGGPQQIWKPGYPLGAFYVYKVVGFDDKGAFLYEKSDGTTTTSPTSEDQYIMGQAEPKFTFGWNNTLTWKNWSANIFLNAATGMNRLNFARFSLSSMTGPYRFIRTRDTFSQGWDHVQNKSDAKYPSHTNPDTKYYVNSDYWLEDASYLKIKNVNISYNLPRDITRFADVKLSFNIENVYTFTKYTGMDPEVYNFDNGVDRGAYPVPRTFTFGASLTF